MSKQTGPAFDFLSMMVGSLVTLGIHSIDEGLGQTPTFDPQAQVVCGAAMLGIAILMILHRFFDTYAISEPDEEK